MVEIVMDEEERYFDKLTQSIREVGRYVLSRLTHEFMSEHLLFTDPLFKMGRLELVSEPFENAWEFFLRRIVPLFLTEEEKMELQQITVFSMVEDEKTVRAKQDKKLREILYREMEDTGNIGILEIARFCLEKPHIVALKLLRRKGEEQ